MHAFLATAFFLLSGISGLCYEVAWARRLELTFGSTAYSIGVVLAVYLGGLGLGAWYFGKLADRAGSPARRYAALEAGIGVWGLIAPWLLVGVDTAYAGLGGAGGLFTKVLLTAVALLPSTFLMGGTLPVLARPFVDRVESSQRVVGWLYGINTFGAVLGVLLADLVLVDRLGLAGTSRAAGVLNLALAGLAWLLASRITPAVEERTSTFVPVPRSAWILAAVVGFTGLSLEVAWSRTLGLALGSTRHAFAIVLAAVLVGIAGGSYLATRFRSWPAPRGIVTSLLVLGGGTWLFLAAYPTLLLGLFHLVQPRMLDYDTLLAVEFLILLAMVLPAALGLGGAFPWIVRSATQQAPDAGRVVGRVYLANTTGAIFGSLAAAFWVLPTLGSFATLQVMASIAALAALVVAIRSRAEHGPVATVGGALAVVLLGGVLLQPAWDPLRLDLNPTRVRSTVPGRQLGNYTDAYDNGGLGLAYARDGVHTLVTVRRSGELTQLKLGGKTDASAPNDMPTQVLVGAIPFLANPDAARVLVVGAGSGVTARVAADFASVESLDLVEIEPAVIEAAELQFSNVHDNVFARPNVRVHLDDARTVLRTADAPYDVVISEPSNPYISGIANLFSFDHYQHAQEQLAEGGVYLQWIQLYDTDSHMLQSMVRTFLEAFPHSDAWWSYPSDLVLIGSRSPLTYDLAAIDRIVSTNLGLSRDLDPHLHCQRPSDLFSRFLLRGPELATQVTAGEVLRDDRPVLDSLASRARYEGIVPFAWIRNLWQRATAAPWSMLAADDLPSPTVTTSMRLAGARYAAARSPELAVAFLEGVEDARAAALRTQLASSPATKQRILAAAMQTDGLNPFLRLELAQLHIEAGDRSLARQLLDELAEVEAVLDARYFWLRTRLVRTDATNAAEQLRLAREGLQRVRPREKEMGQRESLLSVAARCAAFDLDAIAFLREYAGRDPYDGTARMYLARALLRAGQASECLATLDRLAEQNAMHHNIDLRVLRVRALFDARRPEFTDELRELLREFPNQARNPQLQSFVSQFLDAPTR